MSVHSGRNGSSGGPSADRSMPVYSQNPKPNPTLVNTGGKSNSHNRAEQPQKSQSKIVAGELGKGSVNMEPAKEMLSPMLAEAVV